VNENFPFPTKPPRRRLSAAELELWLDATRSVVRRVGSPLPHYPQTKVEAELHRRAATDQPSKGAGGEAASKEAPPKTRPTLAPIERRLRQKLSRGRITPDAEIDLHGMRQREAFLALRAFLLRAQSDGARLVLVVTGKGNRAASGDFTPGILRKCVPNWLCGADYHAIVAGFEEAAGPHGGSGALYVRLRRRSQPATKKPIF
jgi:DNA-nicking Smr family endonuclease